jgi:hypothetical protein
MAKEAPQLHVGAAPRASRPDQSQLGETRQVSRGQQGKGSPRSRLRLWTRHRILRAYDFSALPFHSNLPTYPVFIIHFAKIYPGNRPLRNRNPRRRHLPRHDKSLQRQILHHLLLLALPSHQRSHSRRPHLPLPSLTTPQSPKRTPLHRLRSRLRRLRHAPLRVPLPCSGTPHRAC